MYVCVCVCVVVPPAAGQVCSYSKKYVRGGAMEMVEMVVRAVQYAQTKVPTRVMVGN